MCTRSLIWVLDIRLAMKNPSTLRQLLHSGGIALAIPSFARAVKPCMHRTWSSHTRLLGGSSPCQHPNSWAQPSEILRGRTGTMSFHVCVCELQHARCAQVLCAVYTHANTQPHHCVGTCEGRGAGKRLQHISSTVSFQLCDRHMSHSHNSLAA